MINSALVSIVMPVYNGQKYLEEQLKSLIDQSYRNLEIIVIDDKSTDSSLEIINNLASTDKRIKVYTNSRNLGLISNYLKGASSASGEFICVCDQDDYWRKDRIEILKGLLDKDQENVMAYSDIEICDENLKPIQSSLGFNETRLKNGYLRELSFLKNVTTHMMVRKQVNDMMITVSGNAPFMHDHLMLILSAGLGKIVYTKEKLIKYRQHSGNEIGAFYPSVINNDIIINDLTQKLEYFRNSHFEGLKFDLDKVESFCECLRSGGIFKRLSFMEYYLFLRNNRLLDKSFGCLECLSPKLYKWMWRKKHLYVYVKRVFFIAWAIVVLGCFINEFIIYKLNKLIEWWR